MTVPSVADTIDLEKDEEMSEVPIDTADHGASLPSPEEARITVGAPVRKRCSGYVYWVVGIVLLSAVIIGIVAGLAGSKANGGSGGGFFSSAPEPRKATKEQVIAYLKGAGISNLTAMETQGTPQNSAVEWIAEIDDRNLEVPDVSAATPYGYKYVARYVLALLWYATNGGSWEIPLGWLSPADVCNWNEHVPVRLSSGALGFLPSGVYCEYGTDFPKLIYLDYNGLSGELPSEIGALTSLVWLAIEGNDLRGGFRKELCDLGQLAALTMMNNKFVSTLPQCIGDMTSLQALAVSKNHFNGEVPDLSGMTNLLYLYLDNNELEGDLTEMFDDMAQLKVLYLDDNNFMGTFDKNWLKNSSNITQVDISGNMFDGVFPGHLLNMSNMEVLDVHDNLLTGTFPSEIKNSTSMKMLSFYNNDIEGRLHSAVANLKNLSHLDASSNLLEGSITDRIGEMTALSYLFVGNNSFHKASLPDTFAHLTNLKELSLKGANLTGTIPSFIGNFSQLKLLDLDNNNFNGTVPATLGNLSNLEFMLLNRNEKLTGPIPKSFANLSSLRSMFLDRTSLSGNLSKVCELPTFNEPKGDADGEEYLAADCGGDNPEVECSCCEVCCDDNNASSCHVNFAMANLEPNWEYTFDRYEFNFGSNETFFEDRQYLP